MPTVLALQHLLAWQRDDNFILASRHVKTSAYTAIVRSGATPVVAPFNQESAIRHV
jgi:hypothetical protein